MASFFHDIQIASHCHTRFSFFSAFFIKDGYSTSILKTYFYLFLPVCGCTTVAITATFPSRPPSSSCSCSNYPVSDKLSSSLVSLVWLWMGSPCGYWWQAGSARGCSLEGSRGREGKRERERERDYHTELLSYISSLEEWTSDFIYQQLKDHPWKEICVIIFPCQL